MIAELLARRVTDAAPGLLGYRLRSEIDGLITEVVLTEVEAYGGEDDPASHAYRGRTRRNGSMFGRAGTLYVYRSYGIHWCMNIATGAEGDPAAVLLRAGTPTVGVDIMEQRRGRADHLADGPGKLSQAMGVDGSFDGLDVLGDGPVRLLAPDGERPRYAATTRIGISAGTDRRWRFVVSEPESTPGEA